jgi:hypothetical protein
LLAGVVEIFQSASVLLKSLEINTSDHNTLVKAQVLIVDDLPFIAESLNSVIDKDLIYEE